MFAWPPVTGCVVAGACGGERAAHMVVKKQRKEAHRKGSQQGTILKTCLHRHEFL